MQSCLDDNSHNLFSNVDMSHTFLHIVKVLRRNHGVWLTYSNYSYMVNLAHTWNKWKKIYGFRTVNSRDEEHSFQNKRCMLNVNVLRVITTEHQKIKIDVLFNIYFVHCSSYSTTEEMWLIQCIIHPRITRLHLQPCRQEFWMWQHGSPVEC